MKPPLTRRSWLGLAGAALGGWRMGIGRMNAATDSGSVAERAMKAHQLIESQVQRGDVAAAAFLVRRDGFEFARAYGRATLETPFLIASPTKPMTASAVMWLRDAGKLKLTDPVRTFFPEFTGDGRDRVTIQHLLTHTSGLPDMLPENVELRKRHAPLGEFVARTCRTPLLFPPGKKVSYQSMGVLLAAAVVEKIGRRSLPALLKTEIFDPLGMKRTSLGLGGRRISETAQCQVAEPSDWDWNSNYWRKLGAPWGGAHSTVHDLATFVEAFTREDAKPWPRETRREMREIQTGTMRPSYGLGWMRERGAFGKTCSASTFGHHGSTGTVVWHDPESRITCVILTTRPATESRDSLILPVSEIVGAS